MANVINKLTVGGISYNIASTAYATCATAASTAAKAAYIDGASTPSGFSLVTGTTVHVKFTYANTASSPTLSINGSTAKSIKLYGTTSPGTTSGTSWHAGEVVSFTYDGSYWQMNKNPAELASLIARIETLEAAIRDYINNGGGGSNPSDPDIDVGVDTEPVSTLAEIKALVSGTAFTFTGTCWIAYKSNKYALLQDATGYITVYNSMSSYSVSTELSTFTGTATTYQGTIQVYNIANITTNGTVSTISPLQIEHIDDFSLVPGYYRLQDKSFYSDNDGTYDWWKCTDDDCIWIRDDCSSHPTSETETYTFDLVIFVGYNGTPPPFKITPNGSNGVLLNLTDSDGESPGTGGGSGDIEDPTEGTIWVGDGVEGEAVMFNITEGIYNEHVSNGLMLNNHTGGYTSFTADPGIAICNSIYLESYESFSDLCPVLYTSDGQAYYLAPTPTDTGGSGWLLELGEYGIIDSFWIQWHEGSPDGEIPGYVPPELTVYLYLCVYA